MNEMTTEARQKLGTYFRESRGEEENRPQIALASKNFAPLICRVVRAVKWRWALGLDSRLPPPTSDYKDVTFSHKLRVVTSLER